MPDLQTNAATRPAVWGFSIQKIGREKALYQLFGGSAASGSDNLSCADRFPAVRSVVCVTATPFDNVLWHSRKNVGVKRLLASESRLEAVGYCNASILKPFENDQGEQVYVDKGDVTLKTEYGLLLPNSSAKASSSSTTAIPSKQSTRPKILQVCDSITAEAAAGKKGLLCIDIACPRVTAKTNTTERAHKLVGDYPGTVFIVVRGGAIVLVRAAASGERRTYRFDSSARKAHGELAELAAETAAAGRGAGQAAGEDSGLAGPAAVPADAEDIDLREGGAEPDPNLASTLNVLLELFDHYLHIPLHIIGYALINRSVSTRADARVPTHIICAPSMGTKLSTVKQMVGRGMGRYVQETLARNGFDCVRVLLSKGDYNAVIKHPQAARFMLRERADGSLEGLTRTIESVPDEYKAVFKNPRGLGQKKLKAGPRLDRMNSYMMVEDAGSARGGARIGQDGRLGGYLHVLLLAFTWISRMLGDDEVSHDDLRQHLPPVLCDCVFEKGHCAPMKELRDADPPLLAHAVTQAEDPVHGMHQLTAAGRQYVDRFADDLHQFFEDV